MLSTFLASPRQSLAQVLNFALVLSTAFMMWKGLSVITDSPSPIVVVLSGSMEPAFQRGDLLFLWNRNKSVEVGEIVVYNVRGMDIPIVHRVVRKYPPGSVEPGKRKEMSLTAPKILTKGDNNVADDNELYAKGQNYLDREKDLIGSVRGYVPAVGYVTILLKGIKDRLALGILPALERLVWDLLPGGPSCETCEANARAKEEFLKRSKNPVLAEACILEMSRQREILYDVFGEIEKCSRDSPDDPWDPAARGCVAYILNLDYWNNRMLELAEISKVCDKKPEEVLRRTKEMDTMGDSNTDMASVRAQIRCAVQRGQKKPSWSIYRTA